MRAVDGATDGAASGLCFGVLGPLQVTRSGERLALGGRQQRAVLALLLAEAGAVVSVGRLADALWGEQTPSGFVTTVQTYVFHLREVLDPGRGHGVPSKVLVTEAGSGYRLDTGDSSVDSAVFEGSVRAGREAMERSSYEAASAELERGLGVWRGEVLADLADLGFVEPFAARLQELRLVAQGLRIEAELALGRHDAALPEINRLIADHPLREQFHAQRIMALYRGGRQSDALAAYLQLRSRLREELGIEPSPPLQELHRAVLAQDPALAWHPPPVAALAEVDAVSFGGGAEGPPAVSNPPAPPVPALQSDRSRRGPSRRVIAAWAAAALVAAGGLTTAMVTLSGANGTVALAANSVGAVEADGSITAQVPVGTDPTGLAFDGNALWVANVSDGTVSRIDPTTHAVLKVDVGAKPESVAVTADDVWVANYADGTVTRINIGAAKVVQTIPVGTGPAAIASGTSGVWVANSGDNTIQRINPITGLPDKPVGVGDGPDGIAVGDDSVWVANAHDGTVSRIDPKTGQDLSSPIQVGSGPKGIAVSGDDVWVANQLSQNVTRISRSTGRTSSIVVGDGPSSVAIARGGSVWVSVQFDGVLTKIDPVSETPRRFPIRSSPRGLAVEGGRVWVASGAFTAATHRGGTLTVAQNRVPGYANGIDPANAYTPLIWRPERLVYDGLVTLRLADGADSQVLVPDLATERPQPSDGGKTYTFTLRPNIRYSTGQEVHASDFDLGVRKALTLKGGNPAFFAGIVGGQHCIQHPDACDLSAGVMTDDASRRVVFHLIAADPEFLYKLTFFVYPAPPGTSPKEVTIPLPGTGPYKISEYTKGKTFALARNPYFKQWSFAAQPDGYPDAIRWLKVADDREAVDAVNTGRADVARLVSDQQTGPALADGLKVRYPVRVKSELRPQTDYEVLNASIPPFNNLKARQAVSYALNRRKLVQLYGGPSVVAATCQMLPPKFPSYSWYCPYTTGSADGRYHGPDLKKALDLVKASGTKGMPVTIYGVEGGLGPIIDAYFGQVLRQLGYQVTLHEMPDADSTYEFLFDPRSHIQAQLQSWSADFPLASNFYDAILACDSENNPGEYCDRQLDHRAARATALEATDPGTALRAWTQIDQTVTDQAPIVPTVNRFETTFVSARVGDFQSNQVVGPLLSQLWVK